MRFQITPEKTLAVGVGKLTVIDTGHLKNENIAGDRDRDSATIVMELSRVEHLALAASLKELAPEKVK